MTFNDLKVKLKTTAIKTVRWCKNNGSKILFWTGVGLTTRGALKGYSNEREIRQLRKEYNETVRIVYNNAHCQVWDREKMRKMNRRLNDLYEKALNETEGKAE